MKSCRRFLPSDHAAKIMVNDGEFSGTLAIAPEQTGETRREVTAMERKGWLCLMLLGLTSGITSAQEQTIPLGRYVPGETGFSGGVAAADPSADTEPVHWHRRYNRPFYYGYSYYYRPAPVYYGFYRPGFSVSYSTFYAPRFYAPPVYYYPSFHYGFYGYPVGFCPIGLKEKVGVAANVLDLALRVKAVVDAAKQPSTHAPTYEPLPNQVTPPPVEVPLPDQPAPRGRFRYDGGPTNPVPQPSHSVPAPVNPAPPRAPQAPAPAADDPGTLQISFPASAAKSPYRYRAYGEK
mgnify:CR=1 FL=1